MSLNNSVSEKSSGSAYLFARYNRYANIKDIHRVIRLCIVMLLLIAHHGALTQVADQTTKTLQQFNNHPEVYLSIPFGKYDFEIATAASLDYISRNRAYLYANRKAFELIISKNIRYTLEKSPGHVAFDLNMVDAGQIMQKDLAETWDFYPTYEAYVELMNQFEQQYPNRVKIHEIGQTVMGRKLLFAQISPDVSAQRAVPSFMYTSTMHGDETTGFVLSLRMIHYLVSNYGVNDEITSLMDQVDIWICPNENPDGTYTNDNSTISGATRSNANGKDLNRNYPGPHPLFTTPPETPIQPETQAMIDFVSSANITMSANIHGGAELLNYPWDAWKSAEKKHPDHVWWNMVSRQYADTAHVYSPSGYMDDQVNGVTHGGDWYVVYGSRQDYMNYYQRCRELTLEISEQKVLNPSLLPDYWEYNYRSLINYIWQATYGIHGNVSSAQTQQPVVATVELTGHDADNSHVTTSATLGYFSRPVMAGTYDVAFTAEGYPVARMPQLKVENFQQVNLTVVLAENTSPLYAYSTDYTKGRVYGAGVYPLGYEAVVRAVPEVGYSFIHWMDAQGAIVSRDKEYVINVTDLPAQVYAVFDNKSSTFAVNFSTGNGVGTLEAFIDSVEILNGHIAGGGTDILFRAAPATGNEIESWVVNGEVVPGNISSELMVYNIDAPLTVQVNFIRSVYALSVVSTDENGGTVEINPSKENYYFGDNIVLKAIPAAGYGFHSWNDLTTDILSQDEEYSFTMPPHDYEIFANFRILIFVSDQDVLQEVKVYPNPSRDQLNIEANFTIQGLEIIDESGRVVKMITVDSGRNTRLSLADFPPGIYLLKVYNSTNIVTRKFQLL